MLSNDIVKRVSEIVSGIRAKDYVREISVFHRIQGSPGIHKVIEYLRCEISKISDAEVEILKYDASGKETIGTWEDLVAWTPKMATLELVEPERGLLADFEAEPISLIAFSRSIDIEAEVVYVGKGLEKIDYEGKDVKGKIVLTENKASIVHRIACIEHGAAGILTFVSPSGIDEVAAMRRYEGIWPRVNEIEQTRSGFSLTQSDGLRIKKWLEEGKTVKVRARVEAKFVNGTNPVLSAVIRGKNPEHEILLIAHVCHPHPGANDNASGSAAILETLRVLSRMIKEGTIEQPEYSIRFLWVPEWHGTIKYIDANVDKLKFRAVINVDMVGADPAKTGSVLHLYRTPYSLPTTLNNIIRYWLREEAKREIGKGHGGSLVPSIWDYRVYSAGSDHFMFTDKTIGIPAVMLNQYPDKYYHTSIDTPDQICPKQMAFVSRVLVLSAVSLSFPKQVIKEIVLAEVGLEISELFTRTCYWGVDKLGRCEGDPEEIYPQVMRWLGYAREISMKTLQEASEEWPLITVQRALLEAIKGSIELDYTSKMMVARKAYEGACAEVGLEAKDEILPDIGKIGLEVEIKRNIKYALSPGYFINNVKNGALKYTKIREEYEDILNRVDELLNLSEDWKLLSEIWDRLCFQFGMMEPKVLLDVVDDLKTLGIIEVREV